MRPMNERPHGVRILLAFVLASGLALAATAPAPAQAGSGRRAPTPPPTPAPPTLSVTGPTVAEGNSDTVPATFVVTLTPRSSRAAPLEHTTPDAPPVPSSGDYRGTRGRVEIPAGIDTATIDVPVHGDTVEEPDETFSLVLKNPVGAVLGVGEAQAEIVDDDGGAGPGSGPAVGRGHGGT